MKKLKMALISFFVLCMFTCVPMALWTMYQFEMDSKNCVATFLLGLFGTAISCLCILVVSDIRH